MITSVFMLSFYLFAVRNGRNSRLLACTFPQPVGFALGFAAGSSCTVLLPADFGFGLQLVFVSRQARVEILVWRTGTSSRVVRKLQA